MHLPALGRTYAAARGEGARLNGAPIGASHRDEPAGARLLASANQMAPAHWPGGAPAVERLFRPSLAYRLCLVAEGAADATVTFRDTWEWDVAAGAVILAEAGAKITDRAGQAAPVQQRGAGGAGADRRGAGAACAADGAGVGPPDTVATQFGSGYASLGGIEGEVRTCGRFGSIISARRTAEGTSGTTSRR